MAPNLKASRIQERAFIMAIAAFFDVDGTLYTAHMWRGLMQYAASHGHANQVRFYYSALMPLYGLRKLHLIGEETFRKPWVSNLGWMLRGWKASEGQAAFRWIAEEYIRPTAREDMIACLREHVAAKHVVVLVSAMLKPALEILGQSLEATGCVGTEIETRDGYFTGRVLPPVCMGIEKDRLTRKFLAERGLKVDLDASFAYADSISDQPLLEMVGRPVAVYPDPQLAALARARGWESRPNIQP
jgi:HAD superfamily hydrolase (TIGR01490 family)